MLMHFHGGGVGHTSTRTATDWFLQDHDWLDQDNGPTQGGDEPDASEDGFDGNDVDEAMDKEGDGDNDSESKHIQGSWGSGRVQFWWEVDVSMSFLVRDFSPLHTLQFFWCQFNPQRTISTTLDYLK